MFVVWLVFAALTGLAALALAWWSLLCALYAERLRTSEVHTVTTGDLWNLRLCRYRKGRAPGVPVLLVHGANANHHNFTSPEGACLVDHLVAKGHDCWAVDLRGCRSSQPPFEHSPDSPTMDDYLLHDLPAVIEYIRKRTGYDQIHWVGHSLGGMLLYAYAQRFGTEHIASGTALGAPIGFDGVRMRKPVEFVFLLRWFRPLAGALLRSFIPFALLAGRGFSLFPVNLRNRPKGMGASYFFNMIENPLPNVLGELGFQINRKIWRMDHDRLDVKAGLATMDFPLLAVCGVRDPFTPLDEYRAFMDRLPTADKQLLLCGKAHGHKHDYDHCDLAFGEEGAREVFEPIAKWIAAHPIQARAAAPSDEPMVSLLRQDERDQILGTPSTADALDPETDLMEAVAAALPPPPAKEESEIVAVPVDLEHTAASALAELEKRLRKSNALTEKPTRSERIQRAASTLNAVAESLGKGDTPRIPQASAPAPAKVKALEKAKTTTAAKATAKATAKAKAVAKPKPAAAKKKAVAKPKPAAKKAAAKSEATPKAATTKKTTVKKAASPATQADAAKPATAKKKAVAKPKPAAKKAATKKPAAKKPAAKKVAPKKADAKKRAN